MSDGSAVVITTAKMLTSDKTSFDGTGLTVDVEVAAKADGSDTTLVSVEEDTQVQKALGVAQTMNGGTTTDDTSSSAASGDASASGDTSASQSTSEGGEAVSKGADSAAPASESTDGE